MPAPDLTQRLTLPRRAVALVLADGPGSGQQPDGRGTPAAYFGGKFRTVDFALSNCLNSGIRRIGVVTQYKSHSLQRHLQRGWSFLKDDSTEFVKLLPPRSPLDGQPRRDGSVAAVALHQDFIDRCGADYVLVLGGDHVYKMNYAAMLADHVAKGRECTVACIEVPRAAARACVVMAVDARGHITDCLDQPAEPTCAPGSSESALASMGIYIFNARYLVAELARDRADPASGHDLGKDIVAHAVRQAQAAAHPFALSCVGATPYWRDVGTLDSYWDANIALTANDPPLDLYDSHWPIRTHQAQLAPAKFLHNQPDRRGMAIESLISGGSIVSGSVLRSVLFSGVRVHSYASVEWSVLLPAVEVGRHARLRRVVVDRGCSIPDGLVIGEDAAADAARFFRTDSGITLVTADRIARLSTTPDSRQAAVAAAVQR